MRVSGVKDDHYITLLTTEFMMIPVSGSMTILCSDPIVFSSGEALIFFFYTTALEKTFFSPITNKKIVSTKRRV